MKPVQNPDEALAQTAAANVSAVLSAPPNTEPAWAKPVISALSLIVFVALIVVAHLAKDSTSMALLSGVGAAMAQQVIGYYLGSSSGSTRKTDLLSQPSVVAAPTVAPVAVAPTAQPSVVGPGAV